MISEIERGIVPINETPKKNPKVPNITLDAQGRILWKLSGNTPEENEQLGIQNVQGLFLEKFPEFLELFHFGEDGKIVEGEKEKAKRFIFEKIGKVKQFNNQMGNSIRKKNIVSYFEGSHFTAIKKAFTPWGIDFLDLSVDLSQKDSWIPAEYIHSHFGLSYETIAFLAGGVPSKKGINIKNRVTLYDKFSLVQRATEYLAGPKANQDSGRLEDSDGNTWISLKVLSGETGIDYSTLKKLGNSVTTVQGKNRRNRKTVFFKESEIREKVNRFLDPPQIDRNTRVYVDGNNKRWVTGETLAKNIGYNTHIYKVLKQLNEVPFMLGRGTTNKAILLFDEAKALEELRKAGLFEKLKKRRGKKDNHSPSPDQANEELMKFLKAKD